MQLQPCDFINYKVSGQPVVVNDEQLLEVNWVAVVPHHPTFPGATFTLTASYAIKTFQLKGTRERIVRVNGCEVPTHVTKALQFVSTDLWCNLLEDGTTFARRFQLEIEDRLHALGQQLKRAAGKKAKPNRKKPEEKI